MFDFFYGLFYSVDEWNDRMQEIDNKEKIIFDLYKQISMLIINKKNKIIYEINNTLVETNFLIGKIIVENEQNGNIRAEYGKEILLKLSKKLTSEFGNGYSRSGLQNMRLFYIKYKICQTLSGNFKSFSKLLSWSHYCYLIYIDDDNERNFYETNMLVK